MKKSQFVVEVEIPDGMLLYNTKNGGLIRLTNSEVRVFNNLTRAEISESHLAQLLLEYEFIIDDNRNEYKEIVKDHWYVRNQQEYVRYVIAPTTKCNFECTYCFECGISRKTMSPELCTEVSEFVLRNSEKASHVDLIWYGGEPLCAEAEIRQISASLLKDDAFSEKYSVQMVTNGFLLTKELVDTLVAAHINMVQITVDGPDYIHDKKRKLRNGKGTFQTILGNIINCNEKIDISLKINVDKINKPYLLELLDVLASKGLKNKIDIALSPVLSSTNKINSDLLTTQEFAECETAFYREALSRGFNILGLPAAKLGYCESICKNDYLINADGNLFACWENIGKFDNNVGSVLRAKTKNQTRSFFEETIDFGEKKCEECSVFPICLGGCPLQKLKNGESECRSIKYNIKDLVRIWYDYYGV